MRILKSDKPIPPAYLKSGKDNGLYDVEKLLWLPGRARPVRRPDMAAVGLTRRGASTGRHTPLVSRPVSDGTAPKVRQGTGLLLPKRKQYVPPKLILPPRRKA